MPAILFGSISTVADTSELQRQAFNEAFESHGLDWNWSREEYLPLLEQSGGKDRIAAYAESVGADVDAEAVHRTKSEIFQRDVGDSGIAPRDGVVETMREARANDMKVGLVTTTSRANIDSLIDALGPEIEPDAFDVIVDISSVDERKPDKAAYSFALASLGEEAAECVALEDNLAGVDSAQSAGISCFAFPNANTAGHDFAKADQRVERLSFDDLTSSISAGR